MKRLRVAFSYTAALDAKSVAIGVYPALASAKFATINQSSLALPSRTANNRALLYYEDTVYSISQGTKYISIAISVLSLLLFCLGYFGAKLPALEGIAVVQLSSLLLVSVDSTAPTFNGLTYLSWSLGATPFLFDQYHYEDTAVAETARSTYLSTDSISTINVFLAALVFPLLVSAILKILSATSCRESRSVTRGWKYSLGSYTFYGLMFLALGEFTSLGLTLRHWEMSAATGIGLAIGSIFAVVYIGYLVGLTNYPLWFGSFKNKFFKF
jgi:hypothetical protein